MQQITITTPDDWHLHFRDGDMLGETVPATARCFARAIVMPNLVPPVVNAKLANEYKARILAARPQGSNFEPLMTLFLTNQTTKQELTNAFSENQKEIIKASSLVKEQIVQLPNELSKRLENQKTI